MTGIYNIEIKCNVSNALVVYLLECMHHELKQSPFCIVLHVLLKPWLLNHFSLPSFLLFFRNHLYLSMCLSVCLSKFTS